jgi:hypothetical protein
MLVKLAGVSSSWLARLSARPPQDRAGRRDKAAKFWRMTNELPFWPPSSW